MAPMIPKVDKPASKSEEKSETTSSRTAFRPSQNWTLLQKSIAPESSKKRKRTIIVKSTKQTPKLKPTRVKKTGLTNYDPWHPNESALSRGTGNSALVDPSKSGDTVSKHGRYVAIDCEMVGVGPDGIEDSLARVSIVNYFGHVLYDAFIKPTQRVTDFRTKFSGIRPADILNPTALPFEDVQARVEEFLHGRVLVGHAVQGDLAVLKLTHPREKIRDTSLYEPFRGIYSAGKTPSLKKVVKGELDVVIQIAEHDSIEDAQAAMALYRSVREEYEKAIRMGHFHGIRPKEEDSQPEAAIVDNNDVAATTQDNVKETRVEKVKEISVKKTSVKDTTVKRSRDTKDADQKPTKKRKIKA